MSRVSVFSSPLLVGFDEIERLLDRAAKSSGDGYPPYNIEKVSHDGNGDMLRITFAVAGFGPDDLEITLEENQLTISGKHDDDNSRSYLHRGIATRQFQRTFVLAEGIEVKSAALENGLLLVDLVRHQPERLIKKIDIKSADR